MIKVGGVIMIHKIGERISSHRKERNLSQEELATLLGVSRQTISKWETGDTLPDIINTVAISKLFHISTDSLILGISKGVFGSSYAGSLKDQKKKIFTKAFIIGSLGSTLFAVTITLLRSFSVENPYAGIIYAIMLPILMFCWGFGIWGFIRAARINDEIKYLDNIALMKTMKE